MIFIYAGTGSPRQEYIFRLVFGHWLRLPFRIIDEPGQFDPTEGVLINYSLKNIPGSVRITPSGLLSEDRIREFQPLHLLTGEQWVLFPLDDEKSALSFDIFSAVFWLITRYEEYLPFRLDPYGRFEVQESLMWKCGVHRLPVVDLWLNRLTRLLQQYDPYLKASNSEFEFLPTYDIDQTWSYLHKGFSRNTAGLIRDLLLFRWQNAALRVKVLRGRKTDPFDCFAWLDYLHEACNLKPLYFIHPGTYGKYDKNIPLLHPAHSARIRELGQTNDIGIHPSFLSFENTELLKREIGQLSFVLGREITKARQHFLRIRLPETYRRYIECGITDDYSLGWAGDSGYRAGTSRSFPFYDLERESATPLMLHPLSMMDGAYQVYRKISAEESALEAAAMAEYQKDTGGRLITLWHNESLSDQGQWKGWRPVYEHILRTITGIRS